MGRVHLQLLRDHLERLAGEGLAPAPLVTGDDLVALGLVPGPAFRNILETLYDRQLRGELPTRAAAIVASMSASPCAADTKPASNAEGAK